MSENKGFKFKLGQKVRIDISSEQGEVIARCEYVKNEPTYELRYQRTNGTGTQKIWPESALSEVK